jgi:hypothetical protein
MNRRRMGRAICHCIGPDETDYVPLDKAKRKGWTIVDMKGHEEGLGVYLSI